MTSLKQACKSLDFEFWFKEWELKIVFQKKSNVFKYLTKENKVLEYYEIVDFFDLNSTEKQIVETLKEEGFYLIWEYDFSDNICLHILKFVTDYWLNNEKDIRQINRVQKTNIDWKITSLLFVKLWWKKTNNETHNISEYINNILKK